jgi:hypothetical protein
MTRIITEVRLVNPLVLSILLALPAADATDFPAQAVKKINAYREIIGVPPVKLDVDLSASCLAHAQYLMQNRAVAFQNKINVHDEDPKLPGFSEAGKRAAKASVISQATGGEPLVGIDAWMASFYHRIPFLDPTVSRVGVGLVQNGRDWAFVLDTASGKIPPKPAITVVCYPVNTQQKVPRQFSLGAPEVPNPIPNNGDSAKAGHPITVTFFHERAVPIKDVSATLTDSDGKEVPLWISWPDRPAVKNHGKNTICMIPQKALDQNMPYTVKVRATVNNHDWQKEWNFYAGTR